MLGVRDKLRQVRRWITPAPPAPPEPPKKKKWKMPLSKKPLAFFDVETTGLDSMKHEIIEMALLMERHEGCWWPHERVIRKAEGLAIVAEPHSHFFVDDSRLEFQARIKPQSIEAAEPIALEVNGYTEDGWRYQPFLDATFASVLVSLMRNAIFIGHNVSFDHDMLSRACQRVGVQPKFGYHKIDTVTLAFEHLAQATDSLSLANVCPVVGVTNEDAHTALADVRRCREVYYKLLRANEEQRNGWSR